MYAENATSVGGLHVVDCPGYVHMLAKLPVAVNRAIGDLLVIVCPSAQPHGRASVSS